MNLSKDAMYNLLSRRKCTMIKYLIVLLIALNVISVFGQNQTQEYLRAQEQLKKTQLLQQLDSGVYYLEIGKYKVADTKFLYVLNNIRSVPSDLTFYFGKNSFLLGKNKQSIDWLNKYIQLKGTNGQFSNEAAGLLKEAEAEYLKEKTVEVKKAEEVLSTNYDIDCGPSGKVSCPVCKGNHVIIKKGPFNDEYKTCPYCNEHGILTCEEYNKLLHGELKAKL
jgi:ssDNA-binding Zn-finger/Zn-ribbon topoisomerase 1